MDEAFLASLGAAVDKFLINLATPLDSESAQLGAVTQPTAAAFRDNPVVFSSLEHQGLVALHDADPTFDLQAFLMRAGEMFLAYHEALDRGELAPVRRFVDENAYMQLEPVAAKTGRRADGPRALRVHSIRPMTAHTVDGLDVVRILITAEQAGQSELLCEYWEVVRNRGVQTKTGLSLTRCPNCGAPVDGLNPTRCAYCDTRLADPALDWVVRRITPQ